MGKAKGRCEGWKPEPAHLGKKGRVLRCRAKREVHAMEEAEIPLEIPLGKGMTKKDVESVLMDREPFRARAS
jgi:hypothetical protein